MRHHLTLLTAALLTLATPAFPDQITLRDGKTLTGTITAESRDTFTLQTTSDRSAIAVTRKIPKSQIAQIARTPASRAVVAQGPAYVRVPVVGAIGKDVTGEAFKAAMTEAVRTGAPFILLDIDSPGGMLADLEPMLASVAATQADGHTVVAYVKDAYSAAAILAMACKQIYLRPGACIGAAVPFKLTPAGPVDVEAKFKSALAAKYRTYVESAGHDGLLLRGMMELNLPLFLDHTPDDKPLLNTEKKGKTIKDKGEILTLTPNEAIEVGLAAGVAADFHDLGKLLAPAGAPWHEGPRTPADVLASTLAAQKQKAAATPGTPEHLRANLDKAKPELDAISTRLHDTQSKLNANLRATAKLKDQVESAARQIQSDCRSAIAKAKTQADTARAKDARDRALANLRDANQPEADRLESEFNKLKSQLAQLRKQHSDLLARLTD